MDYTKGILERLQAMALLLERRRDLRGTVTRVQIAMPSRGEVPEYQRVRAQVEESVGRINGRFTDPGGQVPIRYLHRGVPQETLLAYYRVADVALVTPLSDGMTRRQSKRPWRRESDASAGCSHAYTTTPPAG